MSPKKQNIRGYNQTEIITRILANKTGIREENALYKTRNTKTQSLLNDRQRIKNIEDAFCIKNTDLVKNKNILLFDDIYTTGATVNEISKVLKKAGAKNVFVLVLAKD